MNPTWLIVDLDDGAQVSLLSDRVASWDPTLSVIRPSRNALLYEPDATLYGVAIGNPMTIRLYHRQRDIAPGDVIVVPAGLALEVEPEVDFLAFNASGPAPDHYRERFIQVWGYDHFPAPGPSSDAAGGSLAHVLPPDDPRYRVSASIFELRGDIGILDLVAGEAEMLLVVGLDSPLEVRSDGGRNATLPPGHLLATTPGLSVRLCGRGRGICLRLASEPGFHARRVLHALRQGRPPSPEVTPRRHNPPDQPPAPGNED